MEAHHARQNARCVIEARSVDVSEGGMLVLTREPLRDAETIVVRFAPPLAAKTESLRARVQWVKSWAARNGVLHTAGISFLAVTDEARVTRIAAYAALAQKLA